MHRVYRKSLWEAPKRESLPHYKTTFRKPSCSAFSPECQKCQLPLDLSSKEPPKWHSLFQASYFLVPFGIVVAQEWNECHPYWAHKCHTEVSLCTGGKHWWNLSSLLKMPALFSSVWTNPGLAASLECCPEASGLKFWMTPEGRCFLASCSSDSTLLFWTFHPSVFSPKGSNHFWLPSGLQEMASHGLCPSGMTCNSSSTALGSPKPENHSGLGIISI